MWEQQVFKYNHKNSSTAHANNITYFQFSIGRQYILWLNDRNALEGMFYQKSGWGATCKLKQSSPDNIQKNIYLVVLGKH